jgi:Contractile injection system tube protein
MADLDAFKLLYNLKIIPVNDDGILFGIPFIAMFNPETFVIEEAINWTANCEPGSDGSDMHFQNKAPRSFNLDFTIDGTGVNGLKIPVVAQVGLFRTATTEINGLLHKPAFLIVQYGTFISTCVMTKSTVTYTMFDHTGMAIRAKISASFTERTFGTLSNILDMFSSPDLTHRKTVKEWELLPVLVRNIYNDQHYYLQVARVNKIKNFRRLRAGREIVFPPLAEE